MTKKNVKDDEKMRLSLVLSKTAFERLNVLKDRTEAGTYTEVILKAIKLYHDVVLGSDIIKIMVTKDVEGVISFHSVLPNDKKS